MLKIRYIGPGNYHHRVNNSLKVYNFIPENDFTQIVEWDHIYDIIADKGNGKYCKIEGDPKFNTKVYNVVGVSSLGSNMPAGKLKDEIRIKQEGGSDVVIDDIGEALSQIGESTKDEDQNVLNDVLKDMGKDPIPTNEGPEELPEDVVDDLISDLAEIEQDMIPAEEKKDEVVEDIKPKKKGGKKKSKTIVAEVSSDVDPKSLVK